MPPSCQLSKLLMMTPRHSRRLRPLRAAPHVRHAARRALPHFVVAPRSRRSTRCSTLRAVSPTGTHADAGARFPLVPRRRRAHPTPTPLFHPFDPTPSPDHRGRRRHHRASPRGRRRRARPELTDHFFDVPLDHANPASSPTLEIFAREVVAASKADSSTRADLPYLLPPGRPRFRGWPPGRVRWMDRARHRDPPDPPRSTRHEIHARSAASLARVGDARAQADYLAMHRADAIVADAETVRAALGVDRRAVLGQPRGFCTPGTSVRRGLARRSSRRTPAAHPRTRRRAAHVS